MKLLAIETATEACSVALWSDGELRERFEVAPRRHTGLVLPWADELLAEAGLAKSQLDAIAVGRGPGAFTGVRLAIALAQGMALALDRPIVAVSTLAALATGVATEASEHTESLLAAIDARMGEVYLAGFVRDADGLAAASSGEWLVRPTAPPDEIRGGRWRGVGSGFAAGDGALPGSLGGALTGCDPAALPHAAAVARLGARDFALGLAMPPDRVEPAYLRDKVALTLAEQGKA